MALCVCTRLKFKLAILGLRDLHVLTSYTLTVHVTVSFNYFLSGNMYIQYFTLPPLGNLC